ncbi:O-antigen ligase family protein [Ottowia caeni]|uniref:O-antigen ligase family protein n=1 Tax=Ottowia caeni TaxID=2870339 RepID=UPI001E30EAA5|nr:O-antigen ligase family protein [Ottowia caeni]
MKITRLTKYFGFLFFLVAGVTWVAGEAGQGAEGRLALADLIGVGIILLWIYSSLHDKQMAMKLPAPYRAYLPLLMIFALGVLAARYPMLGALELLIHVFIFVVAIALFNLYSRMPPEDAVKWVLNSVLWSGCILSVLGLIDFFIWPSLFPGSGNGLTGTFRNTGQAGAFFGMYLAIIIPGILSGIIKPKWQNILATLAILFALIFTSKRAATVGLIAGLIFLALSMMLSSSKRDKKLGSISAFVILVMVPLVYFLFQWGLENIEGMAWRFEKKFNDNTMEDFSEGFLAENIEATKAAFQINPIIGVGLGNVAGIITQKYEIHSTYMAILGNSGLLGALAYLFFMAVHIIQSVRYAGDSYLGRYLRYYLPMLMGLVLAWAYTYHLRKREFWILFFVVTLVAHGAKLIEYNRRVSTRMR